ncbi:MAG: cupin domain-containing protein [Beijerinckiaceae bacterium]
MTENTKPAAAAPLNRDARAAMEAMNAEAAPLNIWLRTQANAPAQKAWFKHTGLDDTGQMAQGRVAAGQTKALPHHWSWKAISPYLLKISEVAKNADIPPTEFADRQQFLLTNPGLGGKLQVTSTIRCAVSIYNPGDVARAHLHSPNASRTILSENGGYTTVEGERLYASRGDLLLTPNGTWHDHGNDGADPVMWIDTLDWPVLEVLDCIWLDEDAPGLAGNERAQKVTMPAGYSHAMYGMGGMTPRMPDHRRGIGNRVSPFFQYKGKEIKATLEAMQAAGSTDQHEGTALDFVNPVNGEPLFATLGYGAQMLAKGEETAFKRETASTVYVCIEGRGQTEVAGRTFDWEENDIFVVPNFLWRRHINTGPGNAILYTMTDRPLLEKIGQYRAQGMNGKGAVTQLVV